MKKYKFLTTTILIIGLIMIFTSSETKNLTKLVSNFSALKLNPNTKTEQYIICIDPGHQAKGNSETEQVGPNSGSYKAKVSSGTAGVATKKPEYELNVDISNKERAIFANEKKVDMVVRIHADGSDNEGITGASILIPSKYGEYTSAIYEDSSNCAKFINENMQNNGFKVNGIFERSDLTGFNWSQVPAVLLEMGFMSNYTEDQNMSSPKYQEKMMTSVADGLDNYFKNKK